MKSHMKHLPLYLLTALNLIACTIVTVFVAALTTPRRGR